MSNVHERFLSLPKGDLELLQQRALEIAKVSENVEQQELLELLEIESRGQRFAVPLKTLEGVVELTSVAPIPRAPGVVRGIISFRGELLLGLELSALVGSTSTGITDLRRIIAVNASTMKVAILAEQITSIRAAPKVSFRPDPSRRFSFVVGIDENFVSLIDPDALVSQTLNLLGGA